MLKAGNCKSGKGKNRLVCVGAQLGPRLLLRLLVGDGMRKGARGSYSASLLMLLALSSPAAYAAGDNPPAAAEKATEAASDDKSYLPPWMRGEAGPADASASAAPTQTAEAAESIAAKKARSQRNRRHEWGGGFWDSLLGR